MGLMLTAPQDARLVITPHPVLLDGQRNVPADLLPGESLYAFLMRHIEDLDGQPWAVTIGGREVPRHLWHHVYPKHGQIIEVRGGVGKSAVALAAQIALAYFTLGAGGAGAGGWIAGLEWGKFATNALAIGLYAAGSVLINKVLTPKLGSTASNESTDSVYSISDASNSDRPYEPLPLLLGKIKVTPDRASTPYTWYESDDQYLGMVLTPGLNVHSVDELYIGDALLSSYEGVTVWYSGFAGMAEQGIPLLTNVDTIDGGTLDYDDGEAIQWVQRTSSVNTTQLRCDVEYLIYDVSSKGKYTNWKETVYAEYRAVGSEAWLPFFGGTNQTVLTSNKTSARRKTFTRDVAEGQYEVRLKRNTTGDGTGDRSKVSVSWTTLSSVQPDTADYTGIPRIGIKIKATGQLNGTPDSISCVAHSTPTEVWDGTAWKTQETDNPGALLLRYARGLKAGDKSLAGIGLSDEMIDIEALKSFTLYCASKGYSYNYCIKESRTHEDMCNAIALCGMGQITWASGKFSVVWCAEDQPLSGVVNMATIKNASFQVDYTLANSADGIEYSYFDSAANDTKTLRVVSPTADYQYPLNPSQVTGEGVTTEAHAAVLARYHLAQSLYQYKDISYQTDLEHLSYRRLSMLALQHDMTQWGHGGRVKGATIIDGTVTLDLDESVPAPASGNAYIGLRIPGEAVYRVFQIEKFAGTRARVTLEGTWPEEAALPGNALDNPAHDTLWIYDFKQTPGYRVRVISIEPESDLAGASVSVVPESAEFWDYVLHGTYAAPSDPSLLQTRPVASNVRVSEQQIAQGDTVYTELTAIFDLSGPVARTVVLSDLDGNGELEQVTETTTRTARWRIYGAGTYNITVRPYSPDGIAGTAASVQYTTVSAEAAPILIDQFSVEVLSGGLRRYTWGWADTTIRPIDFAGVEIRYTAGEVATPSWDTMTPLGSDGYHAAAFESALPESGTYTYLVRSRNTAGTLSAGALRQVKTLSNNLGEVITGIEHTVEANQKQSLEAIEQEAKERAAEYAQITDKLADEVKTRAAETAANAAAITKEATTRADAILNEKTERTAAITQESATRQALEDSLSYAISEVAAGSGAQFDMLKVWYFDKDLESWSGQGTPTLVDGWLRPANHTSDPFVFSPANLDVDGSAYRYAKLRVKRVGTPKWAGELRWITTAADFDDTRMMKLAEPSWPADGVATLDFEDVPWWPDKLQQIRLDLTALQDENNYILIDWVAIGRPTPGAGVALVNEEIQARIAADAAEAAQRNTLAVQLRGQYTGSDLASVSSGLVYDERQARVTADEANASAIQTVSARMPTGTDKVASEASVTAEQAARVKADQALSTSLSAVTSRMPSGTGALATEASVTAAQSALTATDQVLASDLAQVKARMPTGSGTVASEASVTAEASARASADEALSQQASTLQSRVGDLTTYRVLSAGMGSNKYSVAGIYDSAGKRVLTFGRSYNLIPINGDGTLGTLTTYDVFGKSANAQALLDAIAALDAGTYFIVATSDEPRANRTLLVDGLAAYGATRAAINSISYRGAYLLIGRANLGEGGGIELVSTVGGASAAWVEYQLQVIQGVPAGLAGSNGLAKQIEEAEASIDSEASTRAAADEVNSRQITSLSNRLSVLSKTGESLIVNGTFDHGLDDWKVATNAKNPVTWGAASGDGKSGVVITRVDDTNPEIQANNGYRMQVRPSRRYRATLRGKSLSGAGNLMARLYRINSAGTQASQDITLTFGTDAFSTQTATFNATAADTTAIMFRIYGYPQNASVALSEVSLVDITDAVSIESTAAALSATETKVTQQGDKITAQGTQIQTLQSSVAGKADVSIVQTLETKVDASFSGSGNLLVNSAFAEGMEGWGRQVLESLTDVHVWRTGDSDEAVPHGCSALILQATGGAGRIYQGLDKHLAVTPDATYILSVYVSGSGTGSAHVQWFDSESNIIDAVETLPAKGVEGGRNLADYSRIFLKSKAPANAALAVVYLRTISAAVNNFNRFIRPMFEQVHADQAAPSPWSAGGAETFARATLALSADGKVAGYSIANTGTTSTFDVQADRFSISPSSSSGARTEFSNGNWRVYDGAGRIRVQMGVNI